jgi:hypothetical protein
MPCSSPPQWAITQQRGTTLLAVFVAVFVAAFVAAFVTHFSLVLLDRTGTLTYLPFLDYTPVNATALVLNGCDLPMLP